MFQLGRPGCNEEQSHEILDKYVELGGNFIDTADMYQCGRSEEIIGSWLKKYVSCKYHLSTSSATPIEVSEGVNGEGIGHQ